MEAIVHDILLAEGFRHPLHAGGVCVKPCVPKMESELQEFTEQLAQWRVSLRDYAAQLKGSRDRPKPNVEQSVDAPLDEVVVEAHQNFLDDIPCALLQSTGIVFVCELQQRARWKAPHTRLCVVYSK